MALGVRGRAGSVLGCCLGLGALSLAFAGCSGSAPEQVAEAQQGIIGGKLDTTHKGVVSLVKQVQGGYHPACSGTLLTKNLVLTAHHCVAELTSSDGGVECGETEFGPVEKASTMLISVEANVGQDGLAPYRVSEVWLPPGAGNAVCGKDIALLLLSGSGVSPNVATPIEPRLDSEVAEQDRFAAIGYGLQDPDDQYGETAGHRMAVSNAQVFCTGAACGNDVVQSGEWVAESPVCSGDSGGPALDQDGHVAGVTSRGDQACTIGIYTSVYAWRDFIRDKTFDAAEAGGYTAPAWAGEPPPGYNPPTQVGGTGGTGATMGGASNAGMGGGLTLAGSAPVIGGTGNAAGGSGNAMSPIVNPLGLECTDRCPGSYACWSESGKPPGICVPRCGEGLKECPTDFSCHANLGACVPSDALKPSTVHHTGSCSVARVAEPASGAASWLALALLGLLAGRRAKLSVAPQSGA